MGDDHGWEETGYNGHPHLKTPVLDEMAATGLRLDHFYAGHPSCSPTRGSVLTGRHPNRYGTFAPGFSLRPEEITIAQIVREAGYATGFFFPADKRDHCEDGHCWVVTRIDGATQEWDIAHHLKLGTRTVAPGLNPKPGFRAACFHSMGLDFPSEGVTGLKALIEPIPLGASAPRDFEAPRIRLDHPMVKAAAE
jgi:arylsulfatase A-like enzyme